MCDSIAIVRPDGVLFAKNSDRDPNEAQVLDWQPRRHYPSGSTLRCTWITIPQAEETNAVLLSRPFWMWGAEIGTNEHGVTIGNEAVFTREPYAHTGLTGMDLLRLALERADSASRAVEIIAELLRRPGQGGGCGHENRNFTYHNSFLVADPHGAYVLETAGRHWAVEAIEGARSISNGLTIPAFAVEHSDFLKTRFSRCRARQRHTQALAERTGGAADLMAALRSHGNGTIHPSYSLLTGGMGAPCMHAGGLAANGQTTASWVAELRRGAMRHWVTETSAPCTSLFKPVRIDAPPGPLAHATDRADETSIWWRHERFHRLVAHHPAAALSLFAARGGGPERAWLRDPPEPEKAFALGNFHLKKWHRQVAEARLDDIRPFWVRHYWRQRNRRAGIAGDTGEFTELGTRHSQKS